MDNIPLALSYDDVLLLPKYSPIKSRSNVDLSIQLTPHVHLKIPILSANMDTVTNPQMAITLNKLGGLGVLPRFNSIEEQSQQVQKVKQAGCQVAAAAGIRNGYLPRIQSLVDAGVDLIIIDVAHGHQEQVVAGIKKIKKTFPKIDLIAGNVATYEGARDLFLAGADCVKVGIGPGTTCTTRVQTGCGVPQISAVLAAAKAASEFKKTLICDGGAKNSGDIVKGLAAGSHAMMLGNLLAGTDEAPGEIITQNSAQYKKYNGSTSIEEKRRQQQKLGKVETGNSYLNHIEGVSALVFYKGPLDEYLAGLLAGIRSGFAYTGSKNISELHKNATFIQITPQGVRESNSHDIHSIY